MNCSIGKPNRCKSQKLKYNKKKTQYNRVQLYWRSETVEDFYVSWTVLTIFRDIFIEYGLRRALLI